MPEDRLKLPAATIFIKKGTPVKSFFSECWETFNTYFRVFMDEQFRLTLFGSNRQQIFFKISIFKNFAIFTEKDLCWNLFSTKLQVRRPSTWLKRAKSKMRTQNLRLRIQDPRPGTPAPMTQDQGPQDPGVRLQKPRTRYPGHGTWNPRTQDSGSQNLEPWDFEHFYWTLK